MRSGGIKMNIFKFYKEDYKWYIDLPDFPGSKEELQMVDGADTWLDKLSNNTEEVTVLVSTEKQLTNKLYLHTSNETGAVYIAVNIGEEIHDHWLWLCPVTLYVFGEYPTVIWYEKQ